MADEIPVDALNVVAQLEMDFDGLRQRMEAQDRLCQLLEAKFKQIERRIAAMEQKTGAWLPEDRYTIYASIASIKARLGGHSRELDAVPALIEDKIAVLVKRIDAMGKVGQ